MIEVLRQIPGPVFLQYFIALSVVCILIGWWRVNADGSTRHSIPARKQFSSSIIASLRSGCNEDIRSHFSDGTYHELERLYLVRDDYERRRVWIITLLMFLAIGGVGGTKLYLGLTHNRPSSFLVILLIISTILLFKLLKPWSSTTQLGKRFLNSLNDTISGGIEH